MTHKCPFNLPEECVENECMAWVGWTAGCNTGMIGSLELRERGRLSCDQKPDDYARQKLDKTHKQDCSGCKHAREPHCMRLHMQYIEDILVEFVDLYGEIDRRKKAVEDYKREFWEAEP